MPDTVKLTKTQRIALEAVRDHEVTYRNAWRSTSKRVFVDDIHQAVSFPFTFRTLQWLNRRELVEMGVADVAVRITDAGRVALGAEAGS